MGWDSEQRPGKDTHLRQLLSKEQCPEVLCRGLALLGVNALPRAGLRCEERGHGDSGPGGQGARGHSDMSSVTQSFCAPEE